MRKIAKGVEPIIGTYMAARILGVSRERTIQLVNEGKLLSQCIGRAHVFRRSDVEQLAADRARQARGDRRITRPSEARK